MILVKMVQLGRRFATTVAMAVLASGLIASSSTQAEAQPYSCEASLNVRPIYCGPAYTPPPGLLACDPLAIQDGMSVRIIVEARNDSGFSTGPLTPPPAGHLTAGQTMKVYYSCTNPLCDPSQWQPGWFTYQSHVSLAGSQFVDDGNGYSGTITIQNPSIIYPAGDNQPKDVVTVYLRANQPPGYGDVYARAGKPTVGGQPNDGSANFLTIDDPNCTGAGSLLGGGQGTSAVARFIPTPTPTPPAGPTPTPPAGPTPTPPAGPTPTPPAGPTPTPPAGPTPTPPAGPTPTPPVPPPPPSIPSTSLPTLVGVALLLATLGVWALRSRGRRATARRSRQ